MMPQRFHQPLFDLNTVPHPASSIFDDNNHHSDNQNDPMSIQDDPAAAPDDDDSPSVSDSESSVTGIGCGGESERSSSSFNEIFDTRPDLMVRLNEDDRAHEVVKQRFLSCTVGGGHMLDLVAIHRRNWLDSSSEAMLIAFQIYTQALAGKNGGETKNSVKYAWFAPATKQGAEKIVCHGFGYEEISTSPYGQGVYLSAADSLPLECLQQAADNDDGVRYVLLCRVLLGRPEAVSYGSRQTHPSSSEFDSGVDSLTSPTKYIIWSSHINTHILPEFVVSFRSSVPLPPPPALLPTTNTNPIPKSSWMPFPALFAVLSRILPQDAMNLIRDKYKEFKERRVTRDELVRIIRQLAGDKLLKTVIISCKEKGFWVDRSGSSTGNGTG